MSCLTTLLNDACYSLQFNFQTKFDWREQKASLYWWMLFWCWYYSVRLFWQNTNFFRISLLTDPWPYPTSTANLILCLEIFRIVPIASPFFDCCSHFKDPCNFFGSLPSTKDYTFLEAKARSETGLSCFIPFFMWLRLSLESTAESAPESDHRSRSFTACHRPCCLSLVSQTAFPAMST